MRDKNEGQVNILSDEPTDKDDFGSHEKVADAIADMIAAGQDCKFIAITGTWGSGKSTVLKILKKKLREYSKSAKIIIFDAWAHKGDPLRRTFLERLIVELSPEWIKKEDWQDELDKLSRKKWSETTTKRPKLKSAGLIYSFSLVLAPIGLILMTLKDSLSQFWFFAGVSLSLTPVFLLVLTGLSYLFAKGIKQRKEQWAKKIVGFIAPFSSQAETEIKTETYQTPDPTSLEFQSTFRRLMTEALRDKSHKLLIAIDNLDRVGTDDALAIWATMKSFFEVNKTEDENWEKRLWVLVPFDPSGINKLWEKEDLTASFINKTFQISFHVPPPVLGNWVDYFKQQLQYALPGADEDERHAIYRIFRLKMFPKRNNPTPRDIKLFINKIGALYRQRIDDKISLPMMALYVSLEPVTDKTIDYLVKKGDDIISPVSKDLVDPDCKNILAAIYFNVPVKKATHILLESDVEKSIIDRQAQDFNRLGDFYGFAEVLEELVEDNHMEWAKSYPESVGFLANAITSAVPLNRECSKRIAKCLCIAAGAIRNWWVLNEELGKGISKLITIDRSIELCRAVITGISATEPIAADESDLKDETALSEWVQGLHSILSAIMELSHSDVIDAHLRCPGKSTTYVQIIRAIAERSEFEEFSQYFAPTAKPESVISELVDTVGEKKYDNSYCKAISILQSLQTEWPWQQLLNAFKNRLLTINQIPAREVLAIINSIIVLRESSDQAGLILKQLAEGGYLLHHLSYARHEEAKSCIGLCLYIQLEYYPSASISTPTGGMVEGGRIYQSIMDNPDADIEVVQEYSLLIIKHRRVGGLFHVLKEDETKKKFIHAILDAISKFDNAIHLFTNDQLINNASTFYSALSEYDRFVAEKVKHSGLLADVMQVEFGSHLAGLYLAIYLTDEGKQRDFVSFIIENLRALSTEAWVNEFNADYRSLFDLASTLVKNRVEIDLKTNYEKALGKFKTNFGQRQYRAEEKISQQWSNLLDAMGPATRTGFLADTVDDIVLSQNPQENVISLFGDELLHCSIIEEKRDQIIQRCFGEFWKNRRIPELRWFVSAVDKCPAIKKCRRDYLDRLKDEVSTLLKSTDVAEEMREILHTLASRLAIPIPEEKDDSEEP